MKIARFLPQFRRAQQGLRDLELREAWSREEIERFQLDTHSISKFLPKWESPLSPIICADHRASGEFHV